MSELSRVRQAFEAEAMVIALAAIHPAKTLAAAVLRRVEYRRIGASTAEVGLVELLVVSRRAEGGFRLLDGHPRRQRFTQRAQTEARCLVALDDEGFTYNKRISHLATIQEHYMILKALAKGASEARIAASLLVARCRIRNE